MQRGAPRGPGLSPACCHPPATPGDFTLGQVTALGGDTGGMRLCPCLPDGRTGSHQGSAGICALTPSPPGRAARGGQGGGVTAFWGVSSTVLPPALPSPVILGTGWGTCCLPSQPAAFWHCWVPEHRHQGVLLGEVWGGTRTQLAAPPALLIPPLSAGHLLRGERRPGLAAICSQRAAALMSPWPRPNGGSGA